MKANLAIRAKCVCKFNAAAVFRGTHALVTRAEEEIINAVDKHGIDHRAAFNNTDYYLPTVYGLTGLRVEKLGDMLPALDHAKVLMPSNSSDQQPFGGSALNAGLATLLAEELIEGVRAARGYWPEKAPWGTYIGSIDDNHLRSWGIQLIDGRLPGFAVILGTAKNTDVAVSVVQELQSRSILVFLCGRSEGRDGNKSISDQLMEAGVELSYATLTIPFGSDTTSTVHALGFATRAALTLGGVRAGQADEVLNYSRQNIKAFVLALGEMDDLQYATLAGAINYGFPIVTDTCIDDIFQDGADPDEAIVSMPFDEIPAGTDSERSDKLVQRCIDVCGLTIKVAKMPIPVAYGSAFEGERVRADRLRVEFGRRGSTCFEYLRMRSIEEVEDGKITVIGDELDAVSVGAAMHLGIVVDVAGRKMERDFESVIERQIHHFINGAEGVQHVGQRDLAWIRLSRSCAEKGFRIGHLGEIIRARILGEYSAVVQKVQVTLYTDPKAVKEALLVARDAYEQRDSRLAGMTDESTDTFYSCTLCQSFAPSHVCVVTPEHPSLCGAYSWLDCKAAYQMNPTGPNKPVAKGSLIDLEKGRWEGPNGFVFSYSGRNVETVDLYSIMEHPMTSCGCFECIAVVIPEANGVLVVSREDAGMTPAGMNFSTLANLVGGGYQTPGMMGMGNRYLTSKKFLSAEGGIRRLVWVSKYLKDAMAAELQTACEREGEPELLDKIADGTRAATLAQLLAWLEQKGHPALAMDPLL